MKIEIELNNVYIPVDHFAEQFGGKLRFKGTVAKDIAHIIGSWYFDAFDNLEQVKFDARAYKRQLLYRDVHTGGTGFFEGAFVIMINSDWITGRDFEFEIYYDNIIEHFKTAKLLKNDRKI